MAYYGNPGSVGSRQGGQPMSRDEYETIFAKNFRADEDKSSTKEKTAEQIVKENNGNVPKSALKEYKGSMFDLFKAQDAYNGVQSANENNGLKVEKGKANEIWNSLDSIRDIDMEQYNQKQLEEANKDVKNDLFKQYLRSKNGLAD